VLDLPSDLSLWPGVYLVVGNVWVKAKGTPVIDGFGATLEPGQIRSRVELFRQVASDLNQVFVLVTTSTVALNEFKPSEVLVPWKGKLHLLGDIQPESWLAHFALGDLYERGKLTPE